MAGRLPEERAAVVQSLGTEAAAAAAAAERQTAAVSKHFRAGMPDTPVTCWSFLGNRCAQLAGHW